MALQTHSAIIPPLALTSSTSSSKEFSEFQLPESPYDMLARLFWIGVSLLESDYEHEFLLAIKLLEKVSLYLWTLYTSNIFLSFS